MSKCLVQPSDFSPSIVNLYGPLLFAGGVGLLNVGLFGGGGGGVGLSVYPLVLVIAKVYERVSVQIFNKDVDWKC